MISETSNTIYGDSAFAEYYQNNDLRASQWGVYKYDEDDKQYEHFVRFKEEAMELVRRLDARDRALRGVPEPVAPHVLERGI